MFLSLSHLLREATACVYLNHFSFFVGYCRLCVTKYNTSVEALLRFPVWSCFACSGQCKLSRKCYIMVLFSKTLPSYCIVIVAIVLPTSPLSYICAGLCTSCKRRHEVGNVEAENPPVHPKFAASGYATISPFLSRLPPLEPGAKPKVPTMHEIQEMLDRGYVLKKHDFQRDKRRSNPSLINASWLLPHILSSFSSI